MMKLISDWLEKIILRRKDNLAILCTPAALICVQGGEKVEIDWNAITEIVGFKRDNYTTDLICMLIVSTDFSIELNETMEGWGELTRNMQDFIPGALSYAECFLKVAFPAFETNPIVIYKKS